MTMPQRGNQLGLRPMDRIIVSISNGGVNDLNFNSHDQVANGLVAGYNDQGYPIVFLPGTSVKGFVYPDSSKLSQEFMEFYSNAYGEFDLSKRTGDFTVLHHHNSFKYQNKKSDEKTIDPKFNVKIGQKVRVFARKHPAAADAYVVVASQIATRSYLGTVVGCNVEGEPLIVFDHFVGEVIGFNLPDAYENDKPRVDHAVHKSMRPLIRDYTSRKAVWLNDPSFYEKVSPAQMHTKPAFGVQLGDKVELSFGNKGFDYQYDGNNNTVQGTIVGFHNATGSPVVGFRDVPTDCRGEVWTPEQALDTTMRTDVSSDDVKYCHLIGDEISFKKFGKKKSMPRKTDADVVVNEASDTPQSTTGTMMNRIKKAGMNAPIRAARMQALTNGKKAILSALEGRVDTGTHAMIETVLNTDVGQGVILGAIGLAGPSIPKVGEDPRVQMLCDEFLNEGVAKGFNEGINLLASILGPALASAVAALPPVTSAVKEKLGNSAKKRVHSDDDESEEEEDEETEEETVSSKRKAT